MGSVRRLVRICALFGSLLLCLPPHLLTIAARRRSPWPRRFLAMAARSVGARVQVTGMRDEVPMFILANHVSWVDILALGGATGAAFVSKDDVGRWPLIGWLAAQNNTVFVARERRGALGAQLDALRAALTGHQPVALFPEGTTGDGVTLLPFKPALLAAMVPPPPGIVIQPVHIDYGEAANDIAWHGDEGAGANAHRLLSRRGTIPVTIRFLDPISVADCTDRKAIAARTHEQIARSMTRHSCPSAPVTRPV